MRDFYPEEMRLRTALFDTWRHAARGSGFEEYDACVVESLPLLKRKAGEEIVDQIYAFEDKSGRELALRPEMTPTLARMVAAREGALRFPIKWFTIAQCFRYERTTRGRKREHYQWNLDIIGEPSIAAEAEVIATAVAAMSGLGLNRDQYRIRFSSRALLSELLSSHGIAEEHHAATFLALDKRGKSDDDAIRKLLQTEQVDDATIDVIFNLASISSLDEVAKHLGPDSPAYREVIEFLGHLDAYGIADVAVFDLSVIRGLSYYTGIVFEAFDCSAGLRAIFGGGRYDNLLGDIGGSTLSGVGLGFGDVVIAELLSELNDATAPSTGIDITVGFMQPEQQRAAIRLAADLRKRESRVALALHAEKPKQFFSKANKTGAAKAVYIGPDDAERGTARIKDLATRTEEEIPLTTD